MGIMAIYMGGNNLLPYKKTSFGTRIKKAFNLISEDSGEIFSICTEIDKLCISLDTQILLRRPENKGTPYIQPLINLVQRPRGLNEYKRRQIAYKYLLDNDFLKKN